MRLGIVGTENSHAEHFVRIFNEETRYPGFRIAALAGGESGRNRELAERGAIRHIVPAARDLAGHADAGIVCSRDGRQHRDEAIALLDSSLPVFVDKPLACTTVDARAILDAAARNGVAVTSFSPLRWSLRESGLDRWLGTDEPPEMVSVRGPADQLSPYGGLYFYGIHVVEIALALAPGRAEAVRVSSTPDRVTVVATVGPTMVLLEFVTAPHEADPSWHVAITSGRTLSVVDVTLGTDYLAPGIAAFTQMFEGGQQPLTEAELLAPVELLETVAALAVPLPVKH